MATQPELAAFRQIQKGLSERAQRMLSDLYRRLDPADRVVFVSTLTEAAVDVIASLGEISAVGGADFYDALREAHTGLSPFAAEIPAAPPSEQILASTRWALAQPDALGNLKKVADRLTKSPGRIAVEQSMRADPAKPRYARVPQGLETCRFCAMLASRGAVYLSPETADGHDYHDHCDCEATPIFGRALPQGFDPDHYFEVYRSLGGASIDLSGPRSPSVLTA